MDEQKVVEESEAFMRENVPKSRLPEEDYFRHVLGVRKHGLRLAELYDADKFVVEVAALLHDIAADAGSVHAVESAKIAKVFLEKFDLPNETKESILKAIERHSMGSKTETIEQQIIQDADGLSFLGSNYQMFFEIKKKEFPLEEARKLSIEKTNEMVDKIKTKEGQKLAKELLAKALEWLETAE